MACENGSLKFNTNHAIRQYRINFVPGLLNLCHIFESVLQALSSNSGFGGTVEQAIHRISSLRVVGLHQEVVKSCWFFVSYDLDGD